MAKKAVALRAFTHGETRYAKDQEIELSENQFADWSAEGVGLVREVSGDVRDVLDAASAEPAHDA